MEAEGQKLGRLGDGASILLGLGSLMCRREERLVMDARTTQGLQHACLDLTITVMIRGPRHVVIYNISETRV